MIRAAVLIALLAGLYAVVLESGDPADLATGAVAATAVLALTRQLRPPPTDGVPPFWRRLLWFFPWAAVVAREVAIGAWEVTRVSARPSRAPKAGIVAIPVGERSSQGIAVSELAATVSPGEVLIGVDRERDVILLHVLDAADPGAVRERHQRIYDRYQAKVFP